MPRTLQVRRDGAAPIARQIADHLIALLRSGSLAPGDRLPTVRMLAGFLRVNRNTVAKVYRALEQEGWIDSSPGRGTFAAPSPPAAPGAPAVSPAVARYVDRLLMEADARGVSVGDIHGLIDARAAGRRSGAGSPRVGFVECNPSDLAYFTRQLSSRLRIPLEPVLLGSLPAGAEGLDIIATTLFHIEEVRRRLPGREVVGLMAAPDFRTLDEVAHLPPDSRIALICATQEGVASKERSIRAVGIPRARIRTATLQRSDRLQDALRGADVVLASPKVLERLAGQIPGAARVIPFASVLGEGAVSLLEQRMRTWKPRDRRNASRRERAGVAGGTVGRPGRRASRAGPL